jgi:sugar transferase EpsL
MFKRLLDLLLAISASIVLMPIFLMIMIMVLLKLGRPIFFYQYRPGLNKKEFKLIKFRTMIDDNSGRIPPLGKWLRSTSLDEIPSLWNVIKGDMSMVGPRPLLVEYLPLYSEYQNRRHEIRPGITGWAQVNGRNMISWEEKFEMDIWYIENRTLKLDFNILFLTIKKVFFREDINSAINETMPRFKGNKPE